MGKKKQLNKDKKKSWSKVKNNLQHTKGVLEGNPGKDIIKLSDNQVEGKIYREDKVVKFHVQT